MWDEREHRPLPPTLPTGSGVEALLWVDFLRAVEPLRRLIGGER